MNLHNRSLNQFYLFKPGLWLFLSSKAWTDRASQKDLSHHSKSGKTDEDPFISVGLAWIEGELDSRNFDLGATTLEVQFLAQLRYATRLRVRRWSRFELVGAFPIIFHHFYHL